MNNLDPGALANQFALNNIGEYIDEDKYYGSQCWDLSAKYARVCYGCPYFPTGNGCAEGLYSNFLDPLPRYFVRVTGTDLQPGDIAVWDSTFYPPYGHTAVVLERQGLHIRVIEQNGSKDYNGDGDADGVAYVTIRTINNQVNGLRPIGAKMQPATFEQAQTLSQTVLLRPVPMGLQEWNEFHAPAQRTFEQLYNDWSASPEAKNARFKTWDYDRLVAENTDLKNHANNGPLVYKPAPALYVAEGK